MFIVKKYIRMHKTIFKFFIWGGILSDIRSEILFYSDASAELLNMISHRIYSSIPYIVIYTVGNHV